MTSLLGDRAGARREVEPGAADLDPILGGAPHVLEDVLLFVLHEAAADFAAGLFIYFSSAIFILQYPMQTATSGRLKTVTN